jgi:hypothetical protein
MVCPLVAAQDSSCNAAVPQCFEETGGVLILRFFSVQPLCSRVSVVVVSNIPITTEAQRTQTLHREIKFRHYQETD